MKTDDIMRALTRKKMGLTMRMLEPNGGDDSDMVLIEGSAAALNMLAELLAAVASEKENDGFSMSPFGAGSAHFSRSATLGFYIHCLDNER